MALGLWSSEDGQLTEAQPSRESGTGADGLLSANAKCYWNPFGKTLCTGPASHGRRVKVLVFHEHEPDPGAQYDKFVARHEEEMAVGVRFELMVLDRATIAHAAEAL